MPMVQSISRNPTVVEYKVIPMIDICISAGPDQGCLRGVCRGRRGRRIAEGRGKYLYLSETALMQASAVPATSGDHEFTLRFRSRGCW